MYMMYVKTDEDIRRYILNGSTPKVDSREGFAGGPPEAAISMPSFREVLQGGDLEDLVAAYKVMSGMAGPPSESAAERGYQVARTWGCFSCHGRGGSGGLPNPGSFAGFIPGWYGSDFRDLVRGKKEFVSWVLIGGIPRLSRNPLALYFIRRQRIQMPRYRNLENREVEDLWAYVRWLEKTDGGASAQ
jgi:mono/diheme cytochrome c family protein